MTQEALKLALEKIATVNAMDYEYQAWAREALAQEQEPDDGYCKACDGWKCTSKAGCVALDNPPQRTEQEPVIDKSAAIRIATSLGWTPQRTWVGLTDEEIDYFIVHRLTIATKNNLAALIRICEAKLKEKNGV